MAARATRLYTPELLNAAMGLTAFPWSEDLPLRAEARSRSCGSSIAIALAADNEGRITRIGLRPHACAVGQAAAHVFAQGAIGQTRDDLTRARGAIADWLSSERPEPEWPGIALLAPARDYPARHAAILLGWDAAISALG